MAVQSRDWIELHDLLRESLGEQTADKLMDFLPPVGWADVATKDDLRALETRLRGEMAEVRGEIAELRGQIGTLRGDLFKWVTGIVMTGMVASAGIGAAVASVIAG